MPRHSREDDRRRSSPYDSSRDRRSHHDKHKSYGSDDKQYKRKESHEHDERHHYQKLDDRKRNYGGRSKNEDYGNRRSQESSRNYKHVGDRERQYRQRSPSQSDDKPTSKRTSGFDVAPPVGAVLPNPSDNIELHVLPCFSWM